MKVLAILIAGFAACAQAQEIVTLQTRPGVTQSFGRSTLSVAYLARWLETDIQGAVLTSSIFYTGGRNPRPVLVGFNWSQIRPPLLFVHHQDDGCGATPYREAARLGGRYPLITVRGGKPPESGPCDPRSNHGYFGKEAETVDAIAAWMLKKPYSKDIE